MPLSKFSDTFNLPDVMKGTFPHCFNTPNNYGYVGLLPALHYYEPDGLKEPARSKLIKWHGEHSNDEFIFDREIHEYCTTNMTLLKSGCMKFRASFLADTGIDPFRSCTIASACMHVFRTSHLKEKTIARVPPQWLQKYAKLLKQVDGMDHILRKGHRCPIQARVVWG